MNEKGKSSETNNSLTAFPATVVKVLDEYTVAINRGRQHGLKDNQQFLIYRLTDEDITDPETGESLGKLEVVKGTGKVVHLQDKLATIESTQKDTYNTRVIRKNPMIFGIGLQEEVITPSTERLPFRDAQVGDRARPI